MFNSSLTSSITGWFSNTFQANEEEEKEEDDKKKNDESTKSDAQESVEVRPYD